MTEEKWRDSMARGNAARTGGRPDDALAHCRDALRSAPDNAEANSACGLMLLHLDRLDEAAAALKRALDLDPAHPAARVNLAELHARQGDLPGAIRIVETLAAETPHAWWVWDRLGTLKVMANEFAEAAASFRKAVERKPNDPSLLGKWARATFDSGSPAEAKNILDEAARQAPGHEAILRLYAEIYERTSDWANLGRTAGSWLRAKPQNPLPWMHAARAQWETGHFAQAMQSYRTFLDRGGRNAVTLATFGRLCMSAFAYDEAGRVLDEAERLDATCGHMLSAKATLLMFRGRFEHALAYARRATAVDPDDTAAFKVLVQVSGGSVTDAERVQLRRLSENAGLRPQDRITASFALADCLDAQGDTDAAFAAYEHANDLSAERARREGVGYDRAGCERQTRRLMSIFAAAPQAIPDRARPTPIFIVGMPRSGTTLIESILGAHSGVFACGERQEMRSIMQEFVLSATDRGMSGVPEATRQRWRESFWREIPDLGGAIAVTDKNPWNFDALGLILELFPQARVVHVRRDPVETGLSIYRNEFPKLASFANRLEDIAHCYGEYAKLMSHWEAVLPSRFMTIQYEDHLADFERVVPELLRFCGLEWEEACRNFSTGDRVVSTMSTVQVRRPVTEFRGRGGRYARHLSPLIAALHDARVDLRSGAFAPDRSPEPSGRFTAAG
jgi:tetratricopeptide (TPR) repeat protein